MIKRSVLCCLALFCTLSLYCQQSASVRYRDLVFKKANKQSNISYSGSRDKSVKKRYRQMDLYTPAGDTARLRPLIIWIHGGGFKYGNKTSTGTPVWSRTFARRGYVCAAINYRLSKKRPLVKFPHLVEGCVEAMEDFQEVIAYFRKHQDLYRVDMNKVVLAGNSAGGMVAIQSVYSSYYDLFCVTNSDDANYNSRQYNPDKIIAVVNLWGSIYDTTWLKNGRVPIVSIHGTTDKIVPIEHGLAPMYGSRCIHRNADALGIANTLRSYDGFGHELQKHFNPLWFNNKTKKRWLESGETIARFLYKQL